MGLAVPAMKGSRSQSGHSPAAGPPPPYSGVAIATSAWGAEDVKGDRTAPWLVHRHIVILVTGSLAGGGRRRAGLGVLRVLLPLPT